MGRAVLRCLVKWLWVAMLVGGRLNGAEPEGADYEVRVAGEGASAVVTSGTVWLYQDVYGGVQRFKLGEIREGRVWVELSARRLAEEIKPASNTRQFWVVLELPELRWYRSAGIEPSDPLRGWLPALEALGTVERVDSGKLRKLELPALTVRRLRFLSADGVALKGESIPLSVYVTQYNHCAVHEGLPLGVFETDEEGWLEVVAPAMPLYAELRHLVQDGTGFAGEMYACEGGMRIELDAEAIIVRTRLPAERWELRLRDRRGNPVPHVTLVEWIRITGCGANDGPLGKSDAAGRLQVILRPQEIERLALEAESGARRFLTEAELATLMREKSIALEWPASTP
ncbi:MAG: hypothetical protein KJ072_05920 [Verrucomicrobia bacterium]|nr:hypothetical protein [Verrucomicrobiota bacterium]